MFRHQSGFIGLIHGVFHSPKTSSVRAEIIVVYELGRRSTCIQATYCSTPPSDLHVKFVTMIDDQDDTSSFLRELSVFGTCRTHVDFKCRARTFYHLVPNPGGKQKLTRATSGYHFRGGLSYALIDAQVGRKSSPCASYFDTT